MKMQKKGDTEREGERLRNKMLYIMNANAFALIISSSCKHALLCQTIINFIISRTAPQHGRRRHRHHVMLPHLCGGAADCCGLGSRTFHVSATDMKASQTGPASSRARTRARARTKASAEQDNDGCLFSKNTA